MPAKYSKEDINEAVELLNQGDFLKKENVPLGYSAQFKDGWIRLAPGGEPDGEIVDFDK